MLDESAVRRIAEKLLGNPVPGVRRLAAGNSRSTWAVAVGGGGMEARELVLRHDAGTGPLNNTQYSLQREAAVYRALNGYGLPVPELHAQSDDGTTIVIEKVAGSDRWDRALLPPLLRALRQLHDIDVCQLGDELSADSALDDLIAWGQVHRIKVSDPSPYALVAEHVLKELFPGDPDRLVLCHGDTGPLNFLHQDGRITGLIDWEFAHVGDPYDDLAWITVRCWMFGFELKGFAEDVAEHYFESDHLDADRLRYWQAVVLLRNLVIVESAIENGAPGRSRFVHHMLRPALQWKLVESLARLVGDASVEELLDDAPIDGRYGGDILREIWLGLGELVSDVGDDPDVVRRVKLMRKLAGDLASGWTDRPKPVLHGLTGDGLIASLRSLARHAWAELHALPSMAEKAVRPMANFDAESAGARC